jgi:hypothetical protein
MVHGDKGVPADAAGDGLTEHIAVVKQWTVLRVSWARW